MFVYHKIVLLLLILGKLQDAIFPYAINSIFHFVFMPLLSFISLTKKVVRHSASQGSSEVQLFYPIGKNNYVLASLISVTYCRNLFVGFTNILFCERLSFNLFSRTFVNFTIALLIWYDFTSYSIVLPMPIYAFLFRLWGICFRSIILCHYLNCT